MPTVKVTTDADNEGFDLEVEPFKDGGWVSTTPGFFGIRPGPATKIYINGDVHWARRYWNNLMMVPD